MLALDVGDVFMGVSVIDSAVNGRGERLSESHGLLCTTVNELERMHSLVVHKTSCLW